MGGLKALALALFAAAAAFAPAALADEEAPASNDWYIERIGAPTHWAMHKTKAKVFVATERAVVASLNLRDGAVLWRAVLGEEESVVAFAAADSPSAVVVLTSPGAAAGAAVVRAFDGTTGTLMWDAPLPLAEGGASNFAITDLDGDKSDEVAIMHGGKVYAWSVLDGEQRYTPPAEEDAVLPAEPYVSGMFVPAAGRIEAFAVKAHGVSDMRSLHLWMIPLTCGDYEACTMPKRAPQVMAGLWEADREHLLAPAPVPGSKIIVSSGTSACVVNGRMPHCARIPAAATHPYAIAVLPDPSSTTSLLVIRANGQPHALTLDGVTWRIHKNPSRTVSRAWPQDVGWTLLDATAAGGVAMAKITGENLEWMVATGGPALGGWGWQHAETLVGGAGSTANSVLSGVVGAYRKKTGGSGYRLLSTLSDERVVMSQQEQVVWDREEALAHVTASLFVDLPAQADVSLPGYRAPGVMDHVNAQVLALKVQMKLHTPEEHERLTALRQRLSSKGLPYQDPNGMRRMIVVLTESGKLFALHNGDGRVLWSLALPGDAKPTTLLPLSIPHALGRAPRLVVLTADGTPYAIDAHAGIVDSKTTAKLNKLPTAEGGSFELRVLPTPEPLFNAEHDEVKLYAALLRDESGATTRVIPFPSDEASLAAFKEVTRPVFMWEVGGDGASVRGFNVVAASSYEAQTVWELALPGKVLAAEARAAAEALPAYVKLLGDRTPKLKHLSPNVAFFAVGAEPGDDGAEDAALTVYVVNTVTGRVIFSQTHEEARGPVHAVVSEHTVTYQYWCTGARRWAVAALELYDSDAAIADLSPIDMMFGALSDTRAASGYESAAVRVLRSAFYARTGVRGLLATQTKHALTSKQVLMLTDTDQVFALDRRMLDPRRPRTQKLTAAQKEERLMPYSPVLPLPGPLFAVGGQPVARLAAAAVAPAALESTALLFAHGLDAAGGVLTPSKAFDAMGEDFSYGLLVVALLAMAAGAAVLSNMANGAALASKWK